MISARLRAGWEPRRRARVPSARSAGWQAQTQRWCDAADVLLIDADALGVARPLRHHLTDLLQDDLGLPPLERRDAADLAEVLECEVVALAGQRHLVARGPVPGGVVGVGDIERRRELPAAGAVHQESDVLDVVILVSRDHIERHPPELLLGGGRVEAEFAD